MDIGTNIRRLRKLNSYSQREVAEALEVKNTTISNWENNVAKPDINALKKLCILFNCNTEDITGIKEQPRDIEVMLDGLRFTINNDKDLKLSGKRISAYERILWVKELDSLIEKMRYVNDFVQNKNPDTEE